MQQSDPTAGDSKADDNKAKALDWLRARVAEGQALFLTVDDGLARVTYRGFLGHQPPYYFYITTEPGDEIHRVDFSVQKAEIEAPRVGPGGESITAYRTSQSGDRLRHDRGSEIRIHTKPLVN
jgi:hypothetical protein